MRSFFFSIIAYSYVSYVVYILWGNIYGINMRNLCIFYYYFSVDDSKLFFFNKISILR